MKIFFTASLRGTDTHKENYKKIYELIEKMGFTHLDKEIFDLKSEKYYRQIENEGKEGYKDLYQRKLEHVKEADICVYECSVNSLSIGYLIQKSLDNNKPTIVLYEESSVPHFLSGIEEEKLIVVAYKKNNLSKVLETALIEAKERKDKRFNFFISPKLLAYLERQSKSEGVTKSTFIRNLILEHMKKTA